MKTLVKGGAGIIGSNFIRHLLQARKDIEVIDFDKLTYAGNPESLADIEDDPRHQFVRACIADQKAVNAAFENHLDAVVNLAAETHVDRSIEDAPHFFERTYSAPIAFLRPRGAFGCRDSSRSARMRFTEAHRRVSVLRRTQFSIRAAHMRQARRPPIILFRPMRIPTRCQLSAFAVPTASDLSNSRKS